MNIDTFSGGGRPGPNPLGRGAGDRPPTTAPGRGSATVGALAASSRPSDLHGLFSAGRRNGGQAAAGNAPPAASTIAAQGSTAAAAAPLPRSGQMQVGVFSDGTGNSKRDLSRYTNIAKLQEAYADNRSDTFKLYKRGVGTDRGLLGDLDGKAFGFGAMDRIEGLLFDLQGALGRYQQVNGTLPEKITMDVFGFSRGAAGARHFMNVIKQGAFKLDPPFDQIPKEAFEFRFVGLADTVGSFYQPGDNQDGPYTFHIPKDWARNVLHLVADNEYRANFDLQSLFNDQGQVPSDQTEGSYVEDVVMGAHADIGASYSPNEMEHGLSNNQLSRIHLHRFLAEAEKAGAPFQSLAELMMRSPEHWQVDPRVQQGYDRIQGYYDRHPGLEPAHKQLREIERGMEYTRHRIDRLTAESFGDNEEMMDDATRRALENRLSRLSQAAENQRRKLDGILGGEASAGRFLDIYGEFRDRYVHRSHAPVNRTPGMDPQVRQDGRLRREVFYKDHQPLTTVLRPQKFDD